MSQIIPFQSALIEIKSHAVALTGRSGRQVAAQALALVMSAYRSSYADPKLFVRQASSALEDYPEQVLADLANPKIGLVRELKFAPSIAEMVEWCDKRQVELIEGVCQTDDQRAALWAAFQRNEPWAVTFYRLKGISK